MGPRDLAGDPARDPQRPHREEADRTRWLVQLSIVGRAGKPETAKTLSVLPVQLRPGATFTDDAGTWEIVGQPRSQRAGKSVVARGQRPDDPGTLREQWWQAYERVTVRRAATA